MRLPFTQEQFVDLFAAYNASVWPAVLVLWLASLAVSVMLLSRRRHDRWILALLAAHWMWSALGYHVAFFARINSAAWMFAALFPAAGGPCSFGSAEHLSLTRIPTFGVPCPATIFTAGMLLLATPRCWQLATIPIIWSVIGASAAFGLGVHADYALPVAAVALAIFSAQRRSGERRAGISRDRRNGGAGAALTGIQSPRRRDG